MKGPARHKTVLLLDDNQIDNLVNSKILKGTGYAENVLVIQSPQEAIDFIRSKMSFGEEIPEVLFLDIRMPGMNGFDFLRELNLIENLGSSDLKIYILSSSLDPKDHQMIQRNKLILKFIGKPLTAEVLQEI